MILGRGAAITMGGGGGGGQLFKAIIIIKRPTKILIMKVFKRQYVAI